MDESEEEGLEEAPKSKKRLFLIVGALLGVLVLGGGGWYFMQPSAPPVSDGPVVKSKAELLAEKKAKAQREKEQ